MKQNGFHSPQFASCPIAPPRFRWAASLVILLAAAIAVVFLPATAAPLNTFMGERGPNDFPINLSNPASITSIAYNSEDDEYLVVWSGTAEVAGQKVSNIYGQRLSAEGSRLGAMITISAIAPVGDDVFNAYDPDVAYNPQANEYLVVWSGNTGDAPLADDEFEIFGRRVGANGMSAGLLRISDMGPDGSSAYAAQEPAVVYNLAAGEYLAVWSGDDNTGGLVDGEFEIFAQRLSDAGAELGDNDFRISAIGATSDPAYDGLRPDAVYNSVDDQVLVVWNSSHELDAEGGTRFDIFGQLLDADGKAAAVDDFRISQQDAIRNAEDDAPVGFPSAAYNPARDEYLVVWDGDGDLSPRETYERMIFGQRLSAEGTELGEDDFLISDLPAYPDLSWSYTARLPQAAFDMQRSLFTVVWDGTDNQGVPPGNEYEIYARFLNQAGAPVSLRKAQLSEMGSGGAQAPALAFNPINGEFLAAWPGSDAENGQGVFGQRFVPVFEMAFPIIVQGD